MEQNSTSRPFNSTMVQSLVFFVCAILLFAYSIYKHYSGLPVVWEMSPYLFPVLISVFLLLLSISLFADGRRQLKRSQAQAAEEGGVPSAVEAEPERTKWLALLIVVAASVLYFALLPILTFIPATILFLVGLFLYLGERRWWMVALLSILTTGVIYVLFGVLLNVMLP